MQFSELASLFYDFQTTRVIHFLCMTAIVLLLVVHVALTLLVPAHARRHRQPAGGIVRCGVARYPEPRAEPTR